MDQAWTRGAGYAEASAADPEPEVPLYFGLSPNQVVAFNLAQARLLRGWT